MPSWMYAGLGEEQVLKKYENTTSTEIVCVINHKHKNIVKNLTFISKILLPLVLIVLFSIILIYKIIKTKSKVSTFYSKKENEIFRKDVNLAI